MDPMHPADRHYVNQTVRIADLTVVSDVIENVIFENCVIVGPAVVALLGASTLANSSFDGDLLAGMWDIGDRDYVIGAVALMSCTIVGCRLQRIGFAVDENSRAELLSGFGVDPR